LFSFLSGPRFLGYGKSRCHGVAVAWIARTWAGRMSLAVSTALTALGRGHAFSHDVISSLASQRFLPFSCRSQVSEVLPSQNILL
jgi:hypothetical protein